MAFGALGERPAVVGRPAGVADNFERSRGGGIRRSSVSVGETYLHPPAATCRLVDRETDQIEELFIDAAARRYRANLRRHQENWRRAARQVGAVFVPLVAEEFCRTWDFSPLVEAGS